MTNSETYVCVTTRQRIIAGDRSSYKICLDDYGDMSELLDAFSRCFPKERNPEYIFTEWSGIPETAICYNRISADIYEILDALNMLDTDDCSRFEIWCAERGYDPVSDDAYLLASQYSEKYALIRSAANDPPEDEENDDDEGGDIYELYTDAPRTDYEIFDDNYD